MMVTRIFVKSYENPKLNKKEILRYLDSAPGTEIDDLIDSCVAEAEDKLIYKLCYARFPISVSGEDLDLGFTRVSSHSLALCLKECDEIVLLCGTVGVGIDRLIKKYSAILPSRSVALQALGSERVEALCDEFCAELALEEGAKGREIRPRFSPGYGDLPIEMQKDIFATLAPEKYVGVSLGADLFMTPTKSVTAIIGIKNVK